MIIAVAFENGNIYGHFGHTENFLICEVEDKKVIKASIVPTNGAGHGALANFLKQHNVDTLICGGIGSGAINALKLVNIKVYGGCHGPAIMAVEALLNNNLSYNPNANCSHHDENHKCGEHKCDTTHHILKRNI